MRDRSSIFVFCFCLLSLLGGICLRAGENDGKAIVLIGARVIDGTQGPQVENAVLIIEGDKLTTVGPAGSVKYPEDAQVIDCHGQTIIPV
jgi:imidazolonepropionase-like amidohydrolase